MKPLWIQDARQKLGLHSGEAWRKFIKTFNARHKVKIEPYSVKEKTGMYEATNKKYITYVDYRKLVEFQKLRGKL